MKKYTIINITDSEKVFTEWLLDKYWLFGLTWEGKLDKPNQLIYLKYYDELNEHEYDEFMRSKQIVPDKICNFIQFYSKQNSL